MKLRQRIEACILAGCLCLTCLPVALAAGGNAKTEVIWVNDPNAVYEQPESVIEKFLQPPMEFDTPAFQNDDEFLSETRGLTTYDALISYLTQLEAASARMKLGVLGTSSAQGRNIPVAIFSLEGYQSLEAAAGTDKPIIWYQAQIHGHEPASGEGALAVAKDLALGSFGAEVLEDVVVVMAPRYNLDGSVAFVRTLGDGNDGNRDHINMECAETVAAHRAFNVLQPDVVIDAHEYYVQDEVFFKIGAQGSLAAYDALVSPACNLNIPASLRQMSAELFVENVHDAMAERGMRSSYYYTTNEAEFDATGEVNIYEMGLGAKSGANAYGLQNTFSFLVETRGIGIGKSTFARRVAAQVTVCEEIIRTTAENRAQVLAAVDGAKQEIIEKGRTAGDEDTVVITSKAKNVGASTIDVIDIDKLEIVPIKTNFISTRAAEPQLVRERPTAYLIPGGYWEVAEKLACSGVEIKRLGADATLPVQVYTVEERSVSTSAYQGHYRNYVTASVTEGERSFQRGDFVFTMDQAAANLISIALEPESEDGFIQFNYLPAADGMEIPVYRYMEGAPLELVAADLDGEQAPAMTRLAFVEALYDQFGAATAGEAAVFDDTPAGNPALRWAVDAGIVKGNGRGAFQPNQAITREQAAVMLANCAAGLALEAQGTDALQKAADGGQVSSWARAGAGFCLENGILKLMGGACRPQGTVTFVDAQLMFSVLAALTR